ncbi:MAG: hypothetical protein DRP08_06635, partial [Candidatus Aenigmatarchaeota archaeon]
MIRVFVWVYFRKSYAISRQDFNSLEENVRWSVNAKERTNYTSVFVGLSQNLYPSWWLDIARGKTMKYITYITKECQRNAERCGEMENIRKIAQRIEEKQTIQNWDFISSYMKKRLNNYRLIAKECSIDGEFSVIVFLGCFLRGSRKYESFLREADSVCEELLPSREELRKEIEKRKKEDSFPSFFPRPTEIERGYLYEAPELDTDEWTIYESADWVEALKDSKVFAKKDWIYKALSDRVVDSTEYDQTLICDEESGLWILLKYFPQHRWIFLIAPVFSYFGNAEGKIEKLKAKYRTILNGEASRKLILQQSRRAYSHYMVVEEDRWEQIQRNDVGNIALSPEESTILKSLFYKNEERIFPLFINGQPGSGKSTILQYLYASYLGIYLSKGEFERTSCPPLYLTYSRGLLEDARKRVRDILRANPNISSKALELFEKIGDSSFAIFHKFLFSLLPKSSQRRFLPHKRIDFPKFRKMWNERRKKYPKEKIRRLFPELVWHGIRTYIKGMRFDEFDLCTPDFYRELPDKQRSLTEETFNLIYEEAWEKWYRGLCKEEGFWDEQDIIFAVLNEPNLALAKYPGI